MLVSVLLCPIHGRQLVQSGYSVPHCAAYEDTRCANCGEPIRYQVGKWMHAAGGWDICGYFLPGTKATPIIERPCDKPLMDQLIIE